MVQYRLVGSGAERAVPALRLDEAQQVVVDHQDGPLLVLAGPGTGKTATLVEAVAERVRRGVDIDSILILTFAARAAAELRERVATRLAATIREPVARTFHSYAFGVLRSAADADTPAPRLLAGTEQDIMLRELLAGDVAEGLTPWPDSLRPALKTRGFAGELRDFLLRATERDLTSTDLAALAATRGRPDWAAVAQFFGQYQDVTTAQRPGSYDAAELIGAAIGALVSDPHLLARERARRRYIFVDEYQDTDPAQTQLLRLLARGAQELIVVGDPDQSIYGFRGAESDAMTDAARRLGLAELPTVELITSRRSGQVLLDASRRIAVGLPGPAGHRRLRPAAGVAPGSCAVAVYRSASEEATAIAAALRRAHLDDGLPWHRMAVLVRSTVRSAAVLRRALLSAGVPVRIAGADLPLAEQHAVGQVLSALRWVVEPAYRTDDVVEGLLLGPIGDADAMYLRRLRRQLLALSSAAGDSRAPGDAEDRLLSTALDDPGLLAVLPPSLARPLERVARILSAGRRALDAGAGAEDVLWALWQASGLGRVWERQSQVGGAPGAAADRDLDGIIELFSAAARLADRLPGASATALLEYVSAQEIPGGGTRPGAPDADAVAVLTAHSSKGLEWDFVCVAGVQEGVWPDLRRRSSLLGAELLVDILADRGEVSGMSAAPALQDERRLFYVAVTRARQRLLVTAAVGEDEQPSRFLDELDPVEGERALAPSPRPLHLSGIVAELRAVVTDPGAAAPEQHAAAALLARLAAQGVAGADPEQWWGLGPLSDDRGIVDDDAVVRVSPSHVDSYLTCAMKTFLESAGGSDDPGAKAALGTAVHEIAELAADDADLTLLEDLMEQRWGGLDFGAVWYGRRQRRRASEMLARLSQWLTSGRDGLSLLGCERPFSVDVDETGRTVLRGSVDRLERDAQGRAVIVDFKTSGSKVAGAKVATHPQLAAYQLAAELGGFAQDGVVGPSGGACLVQLGATGPITQMQPALADSADPQWIRAAVDRVAALQRGSRFDATVNPLCTTCAVRRFCPAQHAGAVTR